LSQSGAGGRPAGQSGTTRTREDVVLAAGRLFAKRGFHGTSMRDLGEELGLLGSSLYSHVQGKNELLVEVIRRGALMFSQVVADAAAADGSARNRLEHLVHGHVMTVVNNLDEARTFLFEARFLPQRERAQIVAMRDDYERAYRDTIAAGIAEGSFDPELDPGLTAIFILSVLNALIRWYRPTGERSADEIADAIGRFVASGILADGR
jgi:AcrR family transcriptional regulator